MSGTGNKILPNQSSSTRSGYAFVIVSTVTSGLTTVIGKWNLESINPLLMNSLMFSIATVLLSCYLLTTRGIKQTFTLTHRGWFWLSLFSASSWIAIWAFWAGVQRMDPSLASFLNRLEVPIAVFLGILFLKERYTKKESLGAVLSITGIIIMRLTLRMEYSSGFWLVLLGALFFGLTEFLSKIAVRHVEPVILAYIRNMLIALGYWIVFLVNRQGFDGLEKVWLGVVALGFIAPILSRVSYLMALKRMELSKVAIISQAQPVVVLLIALFALGQIPTFRESNGGVFIVIGCLVMILARKGTKLFKH